MTQLTWKINHDFGGPLGVIGIEVSDRGVTQITFGGFARETKDIDSRAEKHLKGAKLALQAYVDGKKRVKLPALDIEGTDFRMAVWETLAKQGWAETLSYGELAEKAGVNPKASRAVGSAMADNPVPLLIPCHRVLAANQKIGGFTGGTERKRALLLHEGAFFKDAR